MDEVIYAGGNSNNNISYYLYNGNAYWTMSPSGWSGVSAFVYDVRADGHSGYNNTVFGATAGLRPVINLKSDTEFQLGGNGTQNNPYIVI